MRNFKKFAAMASAVTLAACAVAPVAMNFSAVAADNYSITISDHGSVSAKAHKFNAYQIFTGTLNDAGSGFTGGSVEWGSAIIDNGAALKAALKDATFSNEAAETAMNSLNDESTAYDVALALEKITSADDSAILATVINKVITDGTDVAASYAGSGDTATIELSAAGYYFVKDVTELTSPGNDALSKFIIRVLGTEIVEIKTDAPSLEKKIWHNDTTAAPTISASAPTGDWGDVGDNQIGDTVYYYIETTVPDMSAYDTYKYIIRDVMSSGLTLNDVTHIYYVPASGTAVELTNTDGITINKKDDANTESVTETFYVDFGDLKSILSDKNIIPETGDKIYTYYNATLNENALVSNSTNDEQNNPNEAWLTYSNNPNQSGSGNNETGDTVHDTVYDWTYTFEASKVDEKGDPLGGAKFSLKSGDTVINLIEITDASDLKVNGIEALASDTRYYRPAKEGETGGKLIETTSDKNKFMFVGLDDTKTYTLTETEAPTNYTKGEPVSLVISDTYNPNGDSVTAITRKVGSQEADSATIINRKGTSLPGTGGIGTTIFYIGGGAMVAVAGVFLITKKRMGKKEN